MQTNLVQDQEWVRFQVAHFARKRQMGNVFDDLLSEANAFLLEKFKTKHFKLSKMAKGRDPTTGLKAYAAVSLYHHLSRVLQKQRKQLERETTTRPVELDRRVGRPHDVCSANIAGGGELGPLERLRTVVQNDPHPLSLRFQRLLNAIEENGDVSSAIESIGMGRMTIHRLLEWARGRYGKVVTKARKR